MRRRLFMFLSALSLVVRPGKGDIQAGQGDIQNINGGCHV
jgi:hypothetical protein